MKGKPTAFYILYSSLLDKYYTGITSSEIEVRLLKHNSSHYGSHYTSHTNDWELRLVIYCDNYTTARKMETYIKRMKSRKFIEKIINDQTQREIFIKKFLALDSPDPSGQ